MFGSVARKLNQIPPTPKAWCPKCGTELEPFWGEDDLVTTLGIGADRDVPPGEHLVLRVECECGFAGRANTARILNPQLQAAR